MKQPNQCKKFQFSRLPSAISVSDKRIQFWVNETRERLYCCMVKTPNLITPSLTTSKPSFALIENLFLVSPLKILIWYWLVSFLNGSFLASFFLYFRLFNTVDWKQMFDKSLPMTGFELRISGVWGDRSTTEPQPLPNWL